MIFVIAAVSTRPSLLDPSQRERRKKPEDGGINHVFNISPAAPPLPHGYPRPIEMRHRGHERPEASQGPSRQTWPLPMPQRAEPQGAQYPDCRPNEQQPTGWPSIADILSILFLFYDACFSSTPARGNSTLLAVFRQTSIPSKVTGWGVQALLTLTWVCFIWTAGFLPSAGYSPIWSTKPR